MNEYTKIQEMAEEIKKLREEIATETVQFQWFDLFKRAAAAILIFIIGMYIIRFLRKLFHNFLIKKNSSHGFRHFADVAFKIGLYIILLTAIASVLGIETASIAALVASIGLTIGLALQGSLSDLASGILLVTLHQIRRGNYVYLAGNKDQFLEVDEIRLFYTSFITVTKSRLYIPNSKVLNEKIENLSVIGKTKVEVDIGISYASDMKQAKKIMEKILMENEYILSEEIEIFIKNLEDSSVTITGRAWVMPQDYLKAKFSITERIKEIYDEEGIVIPYPQMDVYLQNTESKRQSKGAEEL